MKKIIKDALVLFVITLIAGVLLGLVYQITKDAIVEQNAKATLKAYQSLFVDEEGVTLMNEYKEIALTDESTGEDNELALQIADLIAEDSSNCGTSVINAVVLAYDASGNQLGTIVTVTNKEGYGGDIQFSVGFTMEGTISGLEILDISETPGLGMHAKDDSFRASFVGLKADTVTYSKTEAVAENNEIDAITSATYTTKSIVHGTNAAVTAYQFVAANAIGGGSNE